MYLYTYIIQNMCVLDIYSKIFIQIYNSPKHTAKKNYRYVKIKIIVTNNKVNRSEKCNNCYEKKAV